MTLREYAERIEELDLDFLLEREHQRRVRRTLVAKLIGGIAGVIVAASLVAAPVHAAEYPGLLKVTEVQPEYVTGIDGNGNAWEYDVDGDDWEKGDLVAVIFEDNGTEVIFDDDIIAARYVGYAEMYR